MIRHRFVVAGVLLTVLIGITSCGSGSPEGPQHNDPGLPIPLAKAVAHLTSSSFRYQLSLSASPALENTATGSGVLDAGKMAGSANLHLGSQGHTADVIFQRSSAYLKVSTGNGKWTLLDTRDMTGSAAGQAASSLLSAEYLNPGLLLQAVDTGTDGVIHKTNADPYTLTVSLKQAISKTSATTMPAYYKSLVEMLLFGQLSTATEGDYTLTVVGSLDSSGNLVSLSFKTPSPGIGDILIDLGPAISAPTITVPAASDVSDPAANSGSETEKKKHDGDAS